MLQQSPHTHMQNSIERGCYFSLHSWNIGCSVNWKIYVLCILFGKNAFSF